MRLLLFSLLLFLTFNSFAQNTGDTYDFGTPEPAGPDSIPHSDEVIDFFYDYGWNIISGSDLFNPVGSHNISGTIMRHFALGESNFSAGIGNTWGLERYKFTDSASFALQLVNSADSAYLVANRDLDISNSNLNMAYFEIPVELRFNGVNKDGSEGFNLAVGIFGSILFNRHTTVKYVEDDIRKKFKDYQPFHTQRFRFGGYVRLGINRKFRIYSRYSLSPIFRKGEGPRKVDFNPLTVGLSLNLGD